jgi:flagellar motor protein MotB
MSSMKSTFGLAVLLFAAACVSPEEHRRALNANTALQAELASLSETQRATQKENERLRADLDRLGKQAMDADFLRDQKAKLEDLLKRYEEGGVGKVEGVDLVRTPEGYAFRVLGGVLFSSGQAEISENGRKTLLQILTTLKQEGKRVRVDGHTDNEPISRSKWGTNLRLSVERSLAVADFLIKSGMAADSVGVAGYGEYRPAEAGKGADAQAKNRRVEILMLDK